MSDETNESRSSRNIKETFNNIVNEAGNVASNVTDKTKGIVVKSKDSVINVVDANGNGVEKKLLRAALTKGTIYPIVKSVSKWFGVNMTKQIFAGFFKKAIPVVGGIIGGGITYLSFKPYCDKLKASLQDTLLSNPDHHMLEDEFIISDALEVLSNNEF